MTSPACSLRTGGVSDCPKPMGEREGAEALSRHNRPRRQVENPPGFQAGESRPIWPIWKTGEIASCTAGTGRFLRRKTPISQSKNRFLEIFACAVKRRERKLERAAGGAKSTGFCGSLSKNLPAGNAMQSLWRNCRKENLSLSGIWPPNDVSHDKRPAISQETGALSSGGAS